MSAQIIPFPASRRVTTAGRSAAAVEQVIRRAHAARDQRLGFAVGDRVLHLAYRWDGIIAAFDQHEGVWRAMVERSIKGRCVTIPVPVHLLRKIAEGATA